jgi:hypothetical protein
MPTTTVTQLTHGGSGDSYREKTSINFQFHIGGGSFYVLVSDYQLLATHPAPCNFIHSLSHFIQFVLVDDDLLLC